jgi:hypothetical protein
MKLDKSLLLGGTHGLQDIFFKSLGKNPRRWCEHIGKSMEKSVAPVIPHKIVENMVSNGKKDRKTWEIGYCMKLENSR